MLAEVAEGQFATPHAYLHHYDIVDLITVQEVTRASLFPEAERLHDGERHAIQLALELQLALLIEETVGRRVAQSLGLSISGDCRADYRGISSAGHCRSRSADQTQ